MRIRVKDQYRTLCAGCRYGQILRFENRSEPTVYCHDMEKRIRATVASCSRYSNVRTMRDWEMEKIAFIIEKKHGRVVGFVEPGSAAHKQIIGED